MESIIVSIITAVSVIASQIIISQRSRSEALRTLEVNLEKHREDMKHQTEISELRHKTEIENLTRRMDSLQRSIDDVQTESVAKMQQIIAIQDVHGKSLFGVLDGLHQQGCNHNCERAWNMMHDVYTDHNGDLI